MSSSKSQTDKQPMKITALITQLEELVETSPKPKFGGNKRVIDADALLDLLGDMKVTVPEDIRRAQSLLVDEVAIVTLAREEADEIRSNAEREFEARVSEHAILAEAQKRADEILGRAEESARQIVQGSCQYADDILVDIQRYLHDYFNIVDQNRKELSDKFSQTPLIQTYSEESIPQAPRIEVKDEDLDLDLDQTNLG